MIYYIANCINLIKKMKSICKFHWAHFLIKTVDVFAEATFKTLNGFLLVSCPLEASCTSWLSWCYVLSLGGCAIGLMGSSWACVSALSPQVEKWLQSQTTWWGRAAGEVWGGGGRGKPWKTSPHNNLLNPIFIWSYYHFIIWCLFPSQEHGKP